MSEVSRRGWQTGKGGEPRLDGADDLDGKKSDKLGQQSLPSGRGGGQIVLKHLGYPELSLAKEEGVELESVHQGGFGEIGGALGSVRKSPSRLI